MVDKFLEEIEDLKKAKALLEEIWIEIGPYSTVLKDSLQQKINNYFRFDDSE